VLVVQAQRAPDSHQKAAPLLMELIAARRASLPCMGVEGGVIVRCKEVGYARRIKYIVPKYINNKNHPRAQRRQGRAIEKDRQGDEGLRELNSCFHRITRQKRLWNIFQQQSGSSNQQVGDGKRWTTTVEQKELWECLRRYIHCNIRTIQVTSITPEECGTKQTRVPCRGMKAAPQVISKNLPQAQLRDGYLRLATGKNISAKVEDENKERGLFSSPGAQKIPSFGFRKII